MSEDKPHMTQLWQQEVDRRTAAEASLAEKTAAWTKSELRRAAAEAKVARLEGALVDHNDLLRSAFAITKREGVECEIASTNWDAYYNRAAVVLKRHHETANEARAALTEGTQDE
jgi:hypothetical protein